MLYLLDANVLIDANRDYYPISRVPPFWEWLVDAGNRGDVKIPVEVFEEFKDGKKKDKDKVKDELVVWAKDKVVINALVFAEECDLALVRDTIDKGYAPDLTDIEVEEIGRDPFLIAYARVMPLGRCIVTTEGSRPKAQRANRHVPDVCDYFGVKHCNTYEFIRFLDFNTNKYPDK